MEFASHKFPPEALVALTKATAAINSTIELEVVLNQIARSAAEVIRAEASSVLILDRRRNKLVFAAAHGEQGSKLLGREFESDLGIAGHVIRTGKAENISDVSKNPDFFKGIDEQMRFHTRGLMAAPMIHKADVIGVVEVLNREGGGQFGVEDLALLEVFANLAASGARNAQAHANLRRENRALRESSLPTSDIIGASPAVRAMLKMGDRVAPTNATVLLLGETGTGKEVLARYIHSESPRSRKAFVAVNCAALTETLLESELFGHEKGAFTGAFAQHMGRFELADEGTLFLDEIGDISASTQVKLLRLLQEKSFTRVGGTQTIACDVRVIAATNRDLKAAIAAGKFRDDLYYRLNVFPIELPPLRDRAGDIAELAIHFTRQASIELGVPPRSVSADALALLAGYDWPGNIRELANVMERAVLLCDGLEVLPAQLPPEISRGERAELPAAATGLVGQERAMILKALQENRWNQSKTARALGISRDNLRYRIKKYNLDAEPT